MKNKYIIVLLLLIIVFASIHYVFPGEKELMLKARGGSARVIDIREKSSDGRYALVATLVNNQRINYIFDTKTEDLLDINEENKKLMDNKKYSTSEENGTLVIYDNVNKQEIYRVDLIKALNIESNEKLSLNMEWSNTQKFLTIRDFSINKYKYIIIDLEKKMIRRIPVDDTVNAIWSPDDTKAFLETPIKVNDAPGNSYVWDLISNKVEEVKDVPFKSSVNWTPDGTKLYYIEMNDSGKGYGMHIYDIQTKSWSTINLTDKSKSPLEDRKDYIKWISNNEVIFEAFAYNPIPYLSLINNFWYYVVKVNITNGKNVEKRIGVNAFKGLWSDDNKYLYYLDIKGFHKEKLNF